MIRRIAGCVVALLGAVLLGAVSASASAQSREVAPKDSVGVAPASGVKAQVLPPQAVVFSSLRDALDGIAQHVGAVEIESEVDSINGDSTVIIEWQDQGPVISIGGFVLENLNIVHGHETFTVHSLGLFHQQILTTRFSLNIQGKLVITVSDQGDENAVKTTFTESTDGSYSAMRASCKCVGTGTRAPCTAVQCDTAGTACATNPGGAASAYCKWKSTTSAEAGSIVHGEVR